MQMNNQDEQLLEDFVTYLAENRIEVGRLNNTEIASVVATFMSSPNYHERPIDVISVTNLPAPHFSDLKITL